jgi:transposase
VSTSTHGAVDDGLMAFWSCAEPSSETHPSTSGRPRRLTDQQVAWLLEEHSRYLAWRALRTTVRSQRQLAKELGVSQGTVNLAIRWRGQYKQISPELRSKRRPAERRAPPGPDTEDDDNNT